MCSNSAINSKQSSANKESTSSSSPSKDEVTTEAWKMSLQRKEQEGQQKHWKDNNDPNSSQLPSFVEALTPAQQFVVLSSCMFLFFGVHNLLQEAIMKVPGFEGVMLSYMEVLG